MDLTAEFAPEVLWRLVKAEKDLVSEGSSDPPLVRNLITKTYVGMLRLDEDLVFACPCGEKISFPDLGDEEPGLVLRHEAEDLDPAACARCGREYVFRFHIERKDPPDIRDREERITSL